MKEDPKSKEKSVEPYQLINEDPKRKKSFLTAKNELTEIKKSKQLVNDNMSTNKTKIPVKNIQIPKK